MFSIEVNHICRRPFLLLSHRSVTKHCISHYTLLAFGVASLPVGKLYTVHGRCHHLHLF